MKDAGSRYCAGLELTSLRRGVQGFRGVGALEFWGSGFRVLRSRRFFGLGALFTFRIFGVCSFWFSMARDKEFCRGLLMQQISSSVAVLGLWLQDTGFRV